MGLDEADGHAHADGVLDLAGQPAAEALHGAHLVAEDLRGDLDLHFDLVEPFFLREHDLIGRHRALDGQQRGLDLRGKQGDALEDAHLFAPPGARPDAPHGASARAGLGDDRRQVGRAVADQRHGLAAERGEHQLPLFAVGERPAALRVDDLRVEVVFEDVQAVLRAALGGDARAEDLGQAVDVVRLDAGRLLDAAAHGLAAGAGHQGHGS